MSPDVFLSQQGLKYDGSAGAFPGTPAEIVSALITLNQTRTWNQELGDFEYTRYESPAFQAAPPNPATFDPLWVAREGQAVRAYQLAVRTGDPKTVHAAVDKINEIRAVKGGAAFSPMTDFEIFAWDQGEIGLVARTIVSWREPSLEGTPALPQWFDTKEAFDALNEYQVESVPPRGPSPIAQKPPRS